MDPNIGRDRIQALEIERRARDTQHRRDPNQARHRAEADRAGGGKILWGHMLVNALGVGVALGILLLMFFLLRG